MNENRGFQYSLEFPVLSLFTILATPVFSSSRFYLTILLFIDICYKE